MHQGNQVVKVMSLQESPLGNTAHDSWPRMERTVLITVTVGDIVELQTCWHGCVAVLVVHRAWQCDRDHECHAVASEVSGRNP